jgi:predicted ATPase
VTKSAVKRLPEVKSLREILPKGTEGGKEFSRVVDLLLFHEARRIGAQTTLFNDSAGDYKGLDSLSDGFKREGSVGYQYKFYPSPLSSAHRRDIEAALSKAVEHQNTLRLSRWVLVTPEDLIESATRKDGGDVTWFRDLKAKYSEIFDLEHWGHKSLLALFLNTPTLCLYYYPELVDPSNRRRRTIEDTRSRYNKAITAIYNDIQFVGMSVYKPEATRGRALKDIYIPLKITSVGSNAEGDSADTRDTDTLTASGARNVVLGDPGSGKSTLLRFLALSGQSKSLQRRYGVKADGRLPVLVVLRKYADELKSAPNLSLLDYIVQNAKVDLSLSSADNEFFEFYLDSGQTILFFDGLDELPNPKFKLVVRDRIRTFLANYPGNTAIVSSRIVGYGEPFAFDRSEFGHSQVAALEMPQIEQFVSDWYAARIDNQAERKRNIQDLLRIIRDEDNRAIRKLSENPLLLTIVTLVHRIDAVLPDERVVLYQKCTETLLNTWHTWKFREADQKNRGRAERRNRARMEAIAHWMQKLSEQTDALARAVAPYNELHAFLTTYIEANETISDPDLEAQDIAADFLEFIKSKAGLLVEAGDGEYSFVHLTFQEYLTSTFIISANESAGLEGIWKTIESDIGNPKWNEVIRLLVGGLRATVSQEKLLATILEGQSHLNEIDQAYVAELLGGFLLDRVEAAETKSEVIIERMLLAAAVTTSRSTCERLARMIRAWKLKDSYDHKVLEGMVCRGTHPKLPVQIAILAPACGFSISELSDTPLWQRLAPKNRQILKLLFGNEDVEQIDDLMSSHFEALRDVIELSIVTSTWTNLLASRLQAVFCRLDPNVGAKYLFHLS